MTQNQFIPEMGALYTDMVSLDGYIHVLDDGSVDGYGSYFRGATVTHSNTGEYTIVLNQTYNKILGVHIDVQPDNYNDGYSFLAIPSFVTGGNTIVVKTLFSANGFQASDPNGDSGAITLLVQVRAKLSSVKAY